MATAQPAIHVTCPECHWTSAVLAYETKSAQYCPCPHCQHLWNIPLTRKAPTKPSSARLVPSSTRMNLRRWSEEEKTTARTQVDGPRLRGGGRRGGTTRRYTRCLTVEGVSALKARSTARKQGGARRLSTHGSGVRRPESQKARLRAHRGVTGFKCDRARRRASSR